MLLTYLGAYDAHDGDEVAAEERARVERVIADQTAQGTPRQDLLGMPCRPEDLVVSDPSEPHARTRSGGVYVAVLREVLAMSDVHVVLTSGASASGQRLRCRWIDTAIESAFGARIPQFGVDVHGIPGADGGVVPPSDDVFATRPQLVHRQAERVVVHDYAAESGGAALPRWADAEIRSDRSVASRRPRAAVGRPESATHGPSDGLRAVREIKVLVSAAGLYDRDRNLVGAPPDDVDRWERIHAHHGLRGSLRLGRGATLHHLPNAVLDLSSELLRFRVLEGLVRRADLHLVLISGNTARCRGTAEAVAQAERWGTPQLGVAVGALPDERGAQAGRGESPFGSPHVPVHDYVDDDGDANLPMWIERAVARSTGASTDASEPGRAQGPGRRGSRQPRAARRRS